MRLGSDPEVFLLNSKGELTASCGLLNADKWNPMPVPGLPKGFTFQEDNVTVEFGIPPANSADEFVNYHIQVLNAFLAQHKHLKFSSLSATKFPTKQLKHPGANIFGCEPDYNAWTGEVNPRPKAVDSRLRSAGGHVHVETKLNPREVIKAMDIYLGIPSVLMDKEGVVRRPLYGKHGAHRVKPYGVEYRTLSNFWIFKEVYMRWVWRNTARALDAVSKGAELDQFHSVVKDIIDNNNTDLAQEVVQHLNLDVEVSYDF